jgi:hypothetical protein
MTPRTVREIERLRRNPAAETPVPDAASEEVAAAQFAIMATEQAELRPNDFNRTTGRHLGEAGRGLELLGGRAR